MASLLPTIYSDDEEGPPDQNILPAPKNHRNHVSSDSSKGMKANHQHNSIDTSKKINSKDKVQKKDKEHDSKNNTKNKNSNKEKEDDDNNDDLEMNQEFDFGGGILGEDSVENQHPTLRIQTAADWSYKSALQQLLSTSSDSKNNIKVTNVASIIAAARKNMKKKKRSLDAPMSSDDDEHEEDRMNDRTLPIRPTSKDESTLNPKSKRKSTTVEKKKVNDKEDEDTRSSDIPENRNRKIRSTIVSSVSESGASSSSSDDDDSSSSSSSSSSRSDHEDDSLLMEKDHVRDRNAPRSDAKENDEFQNDVDIDEMNESDQEEEEQKHTKDFDEEQQLEAAKAAAFFESEQSNSLLVQINTHQNQDSIEIFSQLNLSRPLLRGVASMGFVTPTPIQARVIPIALAGRDICASAVTGSGKTAAFLLPIMERILQRSGGFKKNTVATTKALILTPTRELAAQCLGMLTTLASFTTLSAILIVGGTKNVTSQASELRTRPDFVIATPGRLLDHLTNSPGVHLDDLEFLILDEADRLLDLGFQDEVHEIIKSCPPQRQTLLFSATMGTKVDDLIKLSLKRPVRVRVTDKMGDAVSSQHGIESENGVEVAHRLEQEFVRVRSGNEGLNREAMLVALLTRTFTNRTIVFFDTKAEAHRMMIICGLCGIKCTELHGNLTQVQRLEALESFREGEVNILLATDLAARGLDINGIDAVINFEMPTQIESYVHRIGRTARAGRFGKACTLIGEGRRYLMKEVIKDAEEKRRLLNLKNGDKSLSLHASTGVIRSRTIPPGVVAHFAGKIASLQPHVQEVLEAEQVARIDRITEMEALKATNIIEHREEILSKPMKEWFASSKHKASIKEASMLKSKSVETKPEQGIHRMTRKKRRMREMRNELAASDETNGQDESEDIPPPQKKIMTDKSVKVVARAEKKKLQKKRDDKDGRSIHDDDTSRNRMKLKEQKKKGYTSSLKNDSLGSGGLFSEEKVAFSKKVTSTKDRLLPTSNYNFQGYDPDKPKRKGKMKSVHGFKSKSKFKRR